MLKKLVCFLLGVISIFLFCGCSEINYMQVILPNGVIMEQAQIKVDRNIVEHAGMDYTDVLYCARDEMEYYFSDPAFDVLGVMISETTVNFATGEVIKYIKYANYDVYCQVYDIDPSEEQEKEIEPGLLWDREIVVKNKLIYASVLNSGIYNNFVDRIKLEYPDLCGFEFADVDCYYCYGVPLTYAKVERLRSNCTYSYDQELAEGSERFFVWQYNHNDPDKEMVIYKNIIHQWAWYVVGILLTLIFMAVLLIVHWYKKKNKKLSQNTSIEVESEIINEKN